MFSYNFQMVLYQGTWLLGQHWLIVRQQSTVKNGDSTECHSPPPSICAAALFYLHYISVYYISDCLGGLFKKRNNALCVVLAVL